jgi:hypothetical protein
MSKQYQSYKNVLNHNNDDNKVKKRNSIANIDYKEIKKILPKTISFTMIDTDSITQPSYIGIGEKFSKCIVCNSNFPKNTNIVCSYKCYKISKKNIEGFSIKCKKCEMSFITKNLFTDYCSDECFNNIRKRCFTI